MSPLSTPIVRSGGGRGLDTAQFDAMSSRLGLSESQRREVDRAKSDILSEIDHLHSAQQAAERKYAVCDGDCASEYNKFSKSSEDLKHYSAEREFDRRLSAILQPSQLQTYQTDAKKNDEPQPKKS
jgi:hypothetical protein